MAKSRRGNVRSVISCLVKLRENIADNKLKAFRGALIHSGPAIKRNRIAPPDHVLKSSDIV
jgi:hypothetical protein